MIKFSTTIKNCSELSFSNICFLSSKIEPKFMKNRQGKILAVAIPIGGWNAFCLKDLNPEQLQGSFFLSFLHPYLVEPKCKFEVGERAEKIRPRTLRMIMNLEEILPNFFFSLPRESVYLQNSF